MIFDKFITVQKSRLVIIGCSIPNIENSNYLSELGQDSIDSVIKDLQWILQQPTGVITWGVDRFMVDSDCEGCLCKDFNDKEIADIPTDIMLDFVKELKIFKNLYEDREKLNSIIIEAFNKIKSDKQKYSRFPNSDIQYYIVFNDIHITLMLGKQDFSLIAEDYAEQLCF